MQTYKEQVNAKLDTLADTINTKAGTSGDMTLDEMIAITANINTGSTVIANPTLAGTEAALTGLEVDGTKYKVDSDYTIHTYTVKTYTNGDSDYQQLRDDIINYRDIKIGSSIGSSIFSCQHVSPDLAPNTLVYTYLSTGDESSYVTSITPVRCLIVYNSTNNTIVISSPTGVRFVKVEANPTLAGGETTLSSLKIDNVNYAVGGGSSSISSGFAFSPILKFGGFDDSPNYNKSVSFDTDGIENLYNQLVYNDYGVDWSRDGVTYIQIKLCPKDDLQSDGMFNGSVSSESSHISWDDTTKSLDAFHNQYLDLYFAALVITISYSESCAPHPVANIIHPIDLFLYLYANN
jgi:hypothetical protein